MRALILIAHGSRRDAANQEIQDLVMSLREPLKFDYGAVEVAFLEIAAPNLRDAASKLIGRGATEIVVLPYFLSAGNHVERDVPNLITQLKDDFPGVAFGQLTHIGAAEGMVAALTTLATPREADLLS